MQGNSAEAGNHDDYLLSILCRAKRVIIMISRRERQYAPHTLLRAKLRKEARGNDVGRAETGRNHDDYGRLSGGTAVAV